MRSDLVVVARVDRRLHLCVSQVVAHLWLVHRNMTSAEFWISPPPKKGDDMSKDKHCDEEQIVNWLA